MNNINQEILKISDIDSTTDIIKNPFWLKYMSHDTTKRVFGSFRPDQTHRPAHPQKQARVSKFWL